ncbi:hypothetical protein KW798_01815 [Candidatus Parcubacteria bacterium]|nr:hypothetical protein [Candidatus Parcubacteria bacterium]
MKESIVGAAILSGFLFLPGDLSYGRFVTASPTINWNAGNVQTITLTSDQTLTFSHGKAGGQYTLIVKQDGLGRRTIIWPSSVQWPNGTAPTLTPTPNAKDIISFVNDGTNYAGSFSLNYRNAPANTIAFDYATGTVDVSGSASSVSWNHTTSGSNRALVVFVYNDLFNDPGGDKVTSVTYNNTPMTRVAVRSNPFKQTVYAYLLINPATGTHPIQVTASSPSNQLGGISMSYTGVNQTDEPDSFNASGGTAGSTFTLSTTVVAENSWLVAAERNDSDIPTVGSGITIRSTRNTMEGVDSGPLGSGPRSVTWNSSSGAVYTGVILSLSPIQ